MNENKPFRRPRGMSEEELCRRLQDADWIPAGMSESECVSILYEIAEKVAPRYRFGYHSSEDMISHAIFKIITELKQGKFKPRGEKPLARQFRNWLRVWMRNRLSNYLRDNSCRYTNPDSHINKSKYNIMHPLLYVMFDLEDSEMFARENSIEDDLDRENTINDIMKELSPTDRKLFLQKINGVTLTEEEDMYLLQLCRNILNINEENNEEEIYSR